MPLFLEASALVKLYVRESGSDAMEDIVSHSVQVGGLYVSELSRVEVVSAIMRKARRRRIRKRVAADRCRIFAEDWRDTFYVVQLDSDVVADSAAIIQRHGDRSIQGGDGVQLACANKVAEELSPPVYTFVGSDRGLNAVARAVGYQVWNPEKDGLSGLLARHAVLWP